MLGLGEEIDEVMAALSDLREVECDIITLGQYLRPSKEHLEVVRYVAPAQFAQLRERAMALGFRHVESGPLVRSSYHAWETSISRKAKIIEPVYRTNALGQRLLLSKRE